MKVYTDNNYMYKFYVLASSVLFVLSTMLIFSSPAHASGEDVKKEVKEAAAAIGDYTVEQKDAAVAKAKKLMDKLDEKTSAWETKIEENWSDLKQSTRENYQESMKKMRKQRNKVSEWYGSMKHSSKEGWNEVKQGFVDSYDGLVDAYSNTEKQVEEDK